MPGQTLFDKIWDRHVIADLGDDYALLHISRHLMHDGGGRGLAMIKAAGQKVRNPDLTFATFDHVISTEPGRDHNTLKPYAQRLYDMRDEAKRWGIKLFDLGTAGPGHHPCRRARAGHQPARHPAGVRRQPHLHPWRHGRHRLRHRRHRGDPCAGDAVAGPAQAQAAARHLRGHAPSRRHAQGHDPAPDRPDRHRRRHGLCGGIRRQRHPRARGRGPAHHLQSLDRARRQDRHDRARREDLRLSQGPALCADRRDVGPGRGRLARRWRATPTRCSTARSRSMSARSRRRSPGAPAPSR